MYWFDVFGVFDYHMKLHYSQTHLLYNEVGS